ncbi:MAG: spermidine synthase [Gammaproteobacteria bacterium]
MLNDRGTLVFALRDPAGLMEVIDQAGVRSLYFGTGARQSSMRLDAPSTLVLGYTRSMLTALLLQPLPQRVLLIGLGGGSLVRFLLRYLPEAVLDCVEMRPGVVELARRYFQVPEDPRLSLHLGDGAEFLRAAPARQYDLILVDAFDAHGLHPSSCAAPFYDDCRRALSETGVLSANLWVKPGSGYRDILRAMQDGFGGPVLRLPVEQRANLIALAPVRRFSRQDLKQLREPARALAARLDLDLPDQLRRLEHANTGLRRRFLPY